MTHLAAMATVENLEIWRAAKRIISQYPQEPELAACQLADDALAVGNMFDFELWQKVAKAVGKMVGQP